MMTFLSIFFVLVIVNVLMIVSSINSVNQKEKKPANRISNPTRSISIIYPMDLIAPEYKKAV